MIEKMMTMLRLRMAYLEKIYIFTRRDITIIYMTTLHNILYAFVLLLSNQQSVQKQSIVGTWLLCKMKHGDVTVMANVCRQMIFFKDGSGCVILPDKNKTDFKWKINNISVEFTFPTVKDKNDFVSKDSIFTYKRFTDTVEHFEIINEASETVLYLGR